MKKNLNFLIYLNTFILKKIIKDIPSIVSQLNVYLDASSFLRIRGKTQNLDFLKRNFNFKY